MSGIALSSKTILRRLKKLEKVFAAGEPRDDWIDVLMWSGENGGVFGHAHCRFSKSRGETRWVVCSDEEEVAIMRGHYEGEGHKLFGKGADVSFAEYLERFSYLGPKALEVRRKLVINRVRGKEHGSRVKSSSG
jgi:hypothetical protein